MSDKRPPRVVYTGDRVADAAQRSAQESAVRLNGSIFAGGVLLDAEIGAPARSGLVFAAGTARSLAHGLGRRARGWIEVYAADVASAAAVGLFATANPAGLSSATHVTVTPTSSGTAFLFVF